MGLFIVFEGIDGSGKTTQARILRDRLEGLGLPCLLTEEPGASETGRVIRELVLNPGSPIGPQAELFLFLADRAHHVERMIKPALDEGKTVVCSRFFYSTLVYQGIVREVAPFEFLLDLNLYAVQNIVPDMVFFLDVDPSRCHQKATRRTERSMGYEGGDRIEQEGLDFQRKAREGYRLISERFGDGFISLDAGSKSIDEVGSLVFDRVRRRLPRD